MERCLLVRKGAWTEQEDQLLRTCIEKYGEGKWHQIPERAGLNRCRKSCRLRWLNYLKPNIKRGEFSYDEIDMIIRLHKLLGNRWSLIAGRLPGRTANDVKNYWNTHLRKKMATSGSSRGEQGLSVTLTTNLPKVVTSSNIIKPRPRTFSKRFFFPSAVTIRNNTCAVSQSSNTEPTNDAHNQKKLSTIKMTSSQNNKGSSWWEDLLVDTSGGHDECINAGGGFCEEIGQEEDETNINKGVIGFGPNNFWNDFSFDVDIWNLLGEEEGTVVRCPI